MEEREIFRYLREEREITDIEFDEVLQLDLGDEDFAKGSFINCTFKHGVLVENHNSQASFLVFENCKFNNSLRYIKSSNDSIISFKKCSFNKVYFSELKVEEILITDCIFNETFNIDTTTCDYISIENPIAQNKAKILINSGQITETSISTKQEFGDISLVDFNIVYLYGKYGHVHVASNSFEMLEISDYENITGVGIVSFSDSNFSGNIVIRNQVVDILDLSDLNQKSGMVRFNELKLNQCSLIGCKFSNLYFNQIEFSEPPDFSESDMSIVKMSNVQWSDKKRSLNNSLLDISAASLKSLSKEKSDIMVSKLKYQHETYRQLKAASITHHNQIEALAFYRNEMRLYSKIIRIEGGIPRHDRFLVFLNRIVSDFGQNWSLPLLWITIVTGSYYFIVDKPNWSYNPEDIGNGILEALYYINPVRKIDDEATRAAQGLDVLFRILNAYFIYHFIKATRKFGKV